MSILAGLDQSMSITPHSLMQQQLKCLEERMKLIEMKVDTAISAIERNYMSLNEVLDAISDPPLKSQQNVGQLSAQLKDIQDILQKGSSNRAFSNSKIDTEPEIEVESFRKTGTVVEQAQSGDKEKERFEKEYGYEIEQLSEVPYEKEQSSSSSSCVSFGQVSMCNKKSPKMFGKSPVKNPVNVHSSDESTISENFNEAASKIEKASPMPSPIKPIDISDDEPIKQFVREPINISDDESVKQISFKDITFCEWISATKKVKVIGQGKLDFQTGKKHEISVKFTSYDKILNYSMKAGAKWKIVGEQNKGVGFTCHEDPEGNGPAKMVIVTFDCPNIAEKLCRFFGENFE